MHFYFFLTYNLLYEFLIKLYGGFYVFRIVFQDGPFRISGSGNGKEREDKFGYKQNHNQYNKRFMNI